MSLFSLSKSRLIWPALFIILLFEAGFVIYVLKTAENRNINPSINTFNTLTKVSEISEIELQTWKNLPNISKTELLCRTGEVLGSSVLCQGIDISSRSPFNPFLCNTSPWESRQPSPGYQGACWQLASKLIKDPELCATAAPDNIKSACWKGYGQAIDDLNLCETLPDITAQQSCSEAFFSKAVLPEECAKVKNIESRQNCYTMVARSQQNPEICTDAPQKNKCLLAFESNFPKACSLMDGEDNQEKCMQEFANNIYSGCQSSLQSPYDWQRSEATQCFRQLAFFMNQKSYCGGIPDDYEKILCQSGADGSNPYARTILPYPTNVRNVNNDCIGLENGKTDGGDLLSSLITDDRVRNDWKLQAFTKDYVLGLAKKVTTKMNQNGDDFYSFYICHLKDGLDVLAGQTLHQGEWPYTDYGEKGGGLPKYGTSTLAIINNNIVSVYKDIQVMNNTATGAEAYPCNASLNNNKVVWSCFMGINWPNKILYFPLNGGVPEIETSQ